MKEIFRTRFSCSLSDNRKSKIQNRKLAWACRFRWGDVAQWFLEPFFPSFFSHLK